MSQSEKIRFERLQVVCRKALQQSIEKSLSLEQLKSCYPTIATNKEGLKALEIARIQIVEFWLENSLNEFKLIFDERDMETKLNELDELIQQAYERWDNYKQDVSDVDNRNGPLFLGSLTPRQIMEANIMHTKDDTIRNLTMIQNQLSLENEELYRRLQDLATHGQDIKESITSQIDFLTKGVDNLKHEDGEVLKKLDELIRSI